MLLKRDTVIGLLLMVLGIYAAITVGQYTIALTPGYPGPKLFPLIAAFGLTVCGTGIFVQSLMQKTAVKKYMDKAGWLRLILVVAMLAAYILGLQYFGFVISTLIILTAFTMLFGKNAKLPLWKAILFAVIITAIIYVCYVTLFHLRLPVGSITKSITKALF